jgi:hypothetical protein
MHSKSLVKGFSYCNLEFNYKGKRDSGIDT